MPRAGWVAGGFPLRVTPAAVLALALLSPLVLAEDAHVGHGGGCTTLASDACDLAVGGPLAVSCEGHTCAIAWDATLAAARGAGSVAPAGVHLYVRPLVQTWDEDGWPRFQRTGERVEACEAQSRAAVVSCSALVTGTLTVPVDGCAFIEASGRYLDADPGLVTGPVAAWAWTGAVTMGVGACHVDGAVELSYYTIN